MISLLFSFFFNDTASTEIYTLSLHDALPILGGHIYGVNGNTDKAEKDFRCLNLKDGQLKWTQDRKSTRLNSSHGYISYAVFCLKKKNSVFLNDSTRMPIRCPPLPIRPFRNRL